MSFIAVFFTLQNYYWISFKLNMKIWKLSLFKFQIKATESFQKRKKILKKPVVRENQKSCGKYKHGIMELLLRIL